MDSIGCKYFAGGGAMKITRGGKRAQGTRYPRCESFALKTKLGFQVANACDSVNPIGGEDGSRSYSRVN
ncbi:hypothetical protein RHMOL_Rhmol01G0261500 [Rhododendron molle]|uniref:Uncharacterized protein n=1 Tax=Rhododendron molle TaxID=49168 RepID=A0ACC0Q575_RHOML|nr:hypothetical protein RHMOL_Rhmol01G0261500 [Rhododendron molle]